MTLEDEIPQISNPVASQASGRTVLRNSGYGFAAQLSIKVLSFLFSVFVIRRLGSNDFGLYSAALAFTTAFAFLSDLGLGVYMVRAVARLREEHAGQLRIQKLYNDVIWLRILLAIGAILVIGAAAILFRQPEYLIGAILLNSLSLLLYAVQGISDAVLAGFERLDITSWGKVINQLVFVGLGAGVLFSGLGYYGLIAASLAGVLALTVFCWQAVRRLGLGFGRPDVSSWMLLLRSSIPFGVITLALGLSYKFDTILLTAYRPPDEVGFYNAAYNLVFSAVLVANVIDTALYPTLSRISVSNPGALPPTYTRLIRFLLAVSLPIAAGGWVVGAQLIPLLYKHEFQSAVPAFLILVWVIPLMFMSDFLGYTIIIGDHEGVVARSVVISTVLNVAANLILVPRYGLMAASWMTVLTEAVLVGQYIWYLQRAHPDIRWMDSVLPPLFSAGFMGVILFLLTDKLGLVWLIAAGGALYLVFSLLFRNIRKEDFTFLRGLLRKDKGGSA